MRIDIKSRCDIEEMAQKPFAERTALISIADWGDEDAELKCLPDFLLRLKFDDIDGDVFIDELGREPTNAERKYIEGKYHMLSDKQAKRIAEFYAEIHDNVDILICQCEHGQSRSAAIAAAILEYESKSGIDIFINDKYYPNKTIFKKIFKQLRVTAR